MKIDENGYRIFNKRRNGKTYYCLIAPTGEHLGEFLLIEAVDAAIEKNLRKQEGRDRPCMRCKKTFRSSWIGNRLCKTCGTIPEGMV